jgi:hypothetical protein
MKELPAITRLVNLDRSFPVAIVNIFNLTLVSRPTRFTLRLAVHFIYLHVSSSTSSIFVSRHPPYLTLHLAIYLTLLCGSPSTSFRFASHRPLHLTSSYLGSGRPLHLCILPSISPLLTTPAIPLLHSLHITSASLPTMASQIPAQSTAEWHTDEP